MNNYFNRIAIQEGRPISVKELEKIAKYRLECSSCREIIEIKSNVENGEIYSCPFCGLSYEIAVMQLLDENGNPYKKVELKKLAIEKRE
ncbi:MAG: hypothetical protein NZ942_01970 [Candidatus Aenigmarchaeota archaeon]|nr:hypothetical protein [Candidatus Aenigmarchaeota archaeon]